MQIKMKLPSQADINFMFRMLHLRVNLDIYIEERDLGNRTAYDKLKADEKQFVDELIELHDYEVAEKNRRKAAAEAKAKKDFESAKKDAAEYFNTPQFREDVIEELISEGCTRLQAEGRTRDQARLFAEAARLNLM